jgi:orotate phosphoribosyltransferase
MVRSKVLAFGDFVTKSGRKTPFFINTGNYSTGGQMGKLGRYYAEAIIRNMGDDNDFNVLYGPAYKGIPLAVAASIALGSDYSRDVSFCFNRKEAKDHGEGGSLIGRKLGRGDKAVIIEDVATAGTSVRESVPIIRNTGADVVGLVVSVDRMERGAGPESALEELRGEFGIRTFSIVNIEEVVGYLHNKEIDGAVVLDDDIFGRIAEYRKIYGAVTGA